MFFSMFFAILIFLHSLAIQIATASMAIKWCNSDFVAVSHPFPFSIAFSISIILSIIQLFIFIMLMFYFTSHAILWSWISLLLANFALTITLVSPMSLTSWLNEWNVQWTNTSHTMSFQYEYRCCGWDDYNDRAITDCPFTYKSGCKDIVTNYIRQKFDQLYYSLILCAAITIYPISTILYFFCTIRPETFWSVMNLPFGNLFSDRNQHED